MKNILYPVLIAMIIMGCDPAITENVDDKQNDQQKTSVGPITLVIHGGAGTILKENMTDDLEAAYRDALREALNTGYDVLENGGTSLEAVTATINVMEDNPLFNAGKGAVFTNQGKNELDASIMDGATGMAGAVAGVTNVKNPINAALEVMNNSPHVMMSGPGAEAFAAERGLELVDPEYFFTERRYHQLQKALEKDQNASLENSGHKFGTVGAVALDQYGNLAAGTSTGGMTNKKFGRIGDAPIIGAGTYADNASCGVSATGHGEYFIRNVVAYDIAALMKYKDLSLKEASHKVVMEKLVEKGGSGGIVALDREGNVAMTFNSSGMYRGYINEKGNPRAFIYKDKD